MAGLVPAIHALLAEWPQERRGCPSAGMTARSWSAQTPSLLALRAEKGRATILRDAPHHAVAAGRDAGLALTVINPEMVLEHAEFAVRAAVVAQRRAAGLD